MSLWDDVKKVVSYVPGVNLVNGVLGDPLGLQDSSGGGGYAPPAYTPPPQTFSFIKAGVKPPKYKSYYDMKALNDLQKMSRTPAGQSQWYNIAKKQLGQQQVSQLDATRAASQTGLSQAVNQLASAGGVSGGARERLGQQAMRQNLLGAQNVYRDIGQQGLGLLAKDEEMRRGVLAALPQAQLQRAQYETGREQANQNLWMQLKELENQRRMGSYAADMAQRGAAATSSAIYASRPRGVLRDLLGY